LDIPLPPLPENRSNTPGGYECRAFCSGNAKVLDLGAEAGATANIAEFSISVEKSLTQTDFAACIPSKPLKNIGLYGPSEHFNLLLWWRKYSPAIAADCGDMMLSEIGPIFLVLQKTETDQVSNCYYSGKESKTSLQVRGSVADKVKLAIHAGFSCTEIGNFGFRHWLQQEGKKWCIFMKTEKHKRFRWRKLKSRISAVWQYLPACF